MPNQATSPGPGKVDIEVVVGTKWLGTVTVPYLLTGSVVSLETEDPVVIAIASLPFVDGVSTSVVTVTIPAAATASLRPHTWHYNLLRTPSGADPDPIFGGLLTVSLT